MKNLTKFLLMLLAFCSISFGQSLTQSNFSGLLVPKYMGSGTSTRLPVVFRAEIQSLMPNTTYRYYVQAALFSDLGSTNPGAGNPMLISQNGSSFTYSTSPSLTTAGGYETFMTDGTGKYKGWFAFVNTGNARFTAGNYVMPTITIDSAGSGTVKFRLALNDSIKVLGFATTAGTNNGTGIYGISNASPKNIVALFDNTAGTGKPLAVTFLESASVTIASTVSYYTDSVAGKNGRWGTIIPNDNANGVKRVEQFSISDGSSVNFNTDPDGTWPSGANTVNPTGGSTTPVKLTIVDAPLRLSQISTSVPEKFSLYQNYPNPFNPVTKIRFSLPQASPVTMKLYDETGRFVIEMLNARYSAGTYEYELDASTLASGIYFYELKTDKFSEVKKLSLVK
ncbi:MAG: T9SS type A sorting domain-containing protein [Ignavibacteria bacterium]|nr:T9SS type A sorting domain-containing protein [Ignavibacteria bacterium]